MSFLLHMSYVFSLLLFLNIQQYPNEMDNVIHAFNSIPVRPEVISYFNSKDVNNSGGHLQGVQLYQKEDKEYVLLSGSSNKQAYCAVVQLWGENQVLEVKNLMEKPFKHAGGFQVLENIMVVGIEDNNKKDRSKVCFYDISDPENISTTPLTVIHRKGDVMRSTSGCVGITKYRNNYLVAVGDWDTKHIDFYGCSAKQWKKGERSFELIFSLNTRTQQKEGWTNSSWYSYQNINLFTDKSGNLYLVGLGQNNRSKDVADLFVVEDNKTGGFALKKVASRSFYCSEGVNFRSGAGFFMSGNRIGIIACESHINEKSYLNIFK